MNEWMNRPQSDVIRTRPAYIVWCSTYKRKLWLLESLKISHLSDSEVIMQHEVIMSSYTAISKLTQKRNFRAFLQCHCVTHCTSMRGFGGLTMHYAVVVTFYLLSWVVRLKCQDLHLVKISRCERQCAQLTTCDTNGNHMCDLLRSVREIK